MFNQRSYKKHFGATFCIGSSFSLIPGAMSMPSFDDITGINTIPDTEAYAEFVIIDNKNCMFIPSWKLYVFKMNS